MQTRASKTSRSVDIQRVSTSQPLPSQAHVLPSVQHTHSLSRAAKRTSVIEQQVTRSRDVPLYPKYVLTQETVAYLKKPTFDIWHWESNEMLCLLEHVFHELGLVAELKINPITLRRWLVRGLLAYMLNTEEYDCLCVCMHECISGC